jgi:outer membrane receptor for ferrienterochelin and colicin
MVVDIRELDEVLVVGYGTMKKKLTTGSNVHVSEEEMGQKHILRLEQALQGLTSGVQITSNSGQPGSNFKVRIRGVGYRMPSTVHCRWCTHGRCGPI